MIEVRSFRDILRLFFIFRREFTLALIVTVCVAIAGAFLLPAKYESKARLLIKPGLDNTTLPIEAANRQALIAPRTQNDPIVDEEKILTGRPVVQQVARHYLEEMAGYQPKGWWKKIKFQIGRALNTGIELLRTILQTLGLVEEQTPAERLAKKLEKNFSAQHQNGSSVIDVRFVWNDPVIAQKVVEFWVQVYLEERSRILGRHSLYPFYEAETRQASEEITGLKLEIAKKLQEIGSFSIKERLENLTNQINKAEGDRFEAQNTLAGLKSNLLKAEDMLKKMPGEEVKERQFALNPAQQDLMLKLNELYLERARLQRIYTPEAPPMVQINDNIAAMQEAIAQQTPHIQHTENRTPNSLAAPLKLGIQDYRLRIDQLDTQIKELDEHVANLSAQRLKVIESEPDLNSLQRRLAVAEQNYALYVDSLEKSRIEMELDKSRISNIAIVEQATLNPSRIFPKSILILLLALPLGCAVGVLAVYLGYLLDQRIHDGGNIENVFSIPLWASLPDISETPSLQRRALYSAAISRLYGMLPRQQIAEKGLTVALVSARAGEGVTSIARELVRVLINSGHKVRLDLQSAEPGEISVLAASNLLERKNVFIALQQADIVILIIEARRSTVPMIENILSIFKTALIKVDGIVINRRHLEIPDRVIRWLKL